MAIIDDRARIAEALLPLEKSGAVGRITLGWPKDFEHLPTLCVDEVTNQPDSHADNKVYTHELVYDVRIFTVSVAQGAALMPQVDATMERLGYELAMTYPDDTSKVRMRVLRYRKYQ